jgi:hypothetical protein
VEGGTYKGVEPALGVLQGVHILYLVANINAASALHAVRLIESNSGRGFVSALVGAFQLNKIHVADGEFLRQILQFATSVLDTFRAVIWVVGKD